MPLGNSPSHVRRGAIRGRKPNPQAGKTSLRRLVGRGAGPQLRDAIAPLRHPTRISAPPGRFSVCRSPGLLQGFRREWSRAMARWSNGVIASGPETCCEKANNCERPDASVSRETAAKAPEIPAGHGPAVQPTSRDSGRFPGRLAVRRAARVSARDSTDLKLRSESALASTFGAPHIQARGRRQRRQLSGLNHQADRSEPCSWYSNSPRGGGPDACDPSS